MKQTELIKLLPKNVFTEFPKVVYRPDHQPRLIQSEAEYEALEGEWFDKPDFTNHEFDISESYNTSMPNGYVPIEFPKIKYAVNKDAVLVNNADEEAALEGEWFDSPDCKAVEPEMTKAEFNALKMAETKAKSAEQEDEVDGDTEEDAPEPFPAKAKKPASKPKADADDLI